MKSQPCTMPRTDLNISVVVQSHCKDFLGIETTALIILPYFVCVFCNPYHVMLLYIKSPWIMISDMLSPHMGDYVKPTYGRSLSRLTKRYRICHVSQQVGHCLAGT